MYPILIEIGPFTLHSFWVFAVVAFIAGSFTFGKLAKRYRLNLGFVVRNGWQLIIGTLIISRTLFVITHWGLFFDLDRPAYQTLIGLISFWDKGLSFWGGTIGFILLFGFIAREAREPLRKWLDIISISLFIGMAIGTIGSFLDGLAYGHDTILPWGVTFQSAVVQYAVPVHPTQIYALIYLICILIFNKVIGMQWINREDGLLFELNVTLYSFFRFLEEFFRGDETIVFFSVIRLPQIIALAIFAFMIWRFHKTRPSGVQMVISYVQRILRFKRLN